MAARRNTFCSQTMGVENPEPGTADFHFTFFVPLHSTGGSAFVETPLRDGPRHPI
jgi:hypothetical protein